MESCTAHVTVATALSANGNICVRAVPTARAPRIVQRLLKSRHPLRQSVQRTIVSAALLKASRVPGTGALSELIFVLRLDWTFLAHPLGTLLTLMDDDSIFYRSSEVHALLELATSISLTASLVEASIHLHTSASCIIDSVALCIQMQLAFPSAS